MKKKLVFAVSSILLLAFFAVFVGCSMDSIKKVEDASTPIITGQPQAKSIAPSGNGDITVTVAAVGGGSLEYQWYSYKTSLEYESHTGMPIEDNDTIDGLTFTGATTNTLNVTVGPIEGTHTFYVVVTHVDNGATGKTRVSVQSNSVTIGVNDPNNAMYPLIQEHPQNVGGVIFRRNMNLPILNVKAESEDGGEISYQWFVAEELTNESGDEVPDATASDFRPVPDKPGQYYYFVKVTNTNWAATGRRSSFTISNPAYVEVIPNPNAEDATIYKQPAGAIYFSGDTVNAITVNAEAEDGGVLSYQWQEGPSATAADEDWEDVTTGTGGTTVSYTPVINTANSAKYYYRVKIENYAKDATNEKYATVYSKAAEVVVTAPYNETTKPPNLTITIGDLVTVPTTVAGRASSAKNQFVRGFGAMNTAWDNFPTHTMADVENMYNPDKLGYNIQRIMILPHQENPVDMLQDFTNTPSGQYFYDAVRLVNYYGGYSFASPWTPPAVWKTNNSTVGTGARLRTIYYPQYANYLRIFAQAMANNGAPIYAVSIQNEPNHDANYDGCNWTGQEMANFFKRVGYFTKAGQSGTDTTLVNWATDIPGYGGGKELPYVLTMSGSSANNPDIHNAALNDPDAKKNIAIVARHPYGSRNINLAGQLTSSGNANATYDDDPREVWETEFNLNTVSNYNLDSTWGYMWAIMNSVDIHIRNNHENVYTWWSAKRFYSMIGDGEYGTFSGQILPRGYALSHWAKFANETYHVGTTASGNLKNDTGGNVAIAFEQNNAGNLNPKNYQDMGSGQHGGSAGAVSVTAAKYTAFVKLRDKDYGTNRPYPDPFYVNLNAWDGDVDDIEFISFVMFTPTTNTGTGGYSMGDVKLVMPAGFKIRGAEAMRTRAPAEGVGGRNVTPEWETVSISEDRGAAYVNLPKGEILSVRLFNE